MIIYVLSGGLTKNMLKKDVKKNEKNKFKRAERTERAKM